MHICFAFSTQLLLMTWTSNNYVLRLKFSNILKKVEKKFQGVHIDKTLVPAFKTLLRKSKSFPPLTKFAENSQFHHFHHHTDNQVLEMRGLTLKFQS